MQLSNPASVFPHQNPYSQWAYGPSSSNPWSTPSTSSSSISDYLKRLSDSFRSGVANTAQRAADWARPQSTTTTPSPWSSPVAASATSDRSTSPPPPYSAQPTTASTAGASGTNEGFRCGKEQGEDKVTRWFMDIDAKKSGVSDLKVGQSLTSRCVDADGKTAFTMTVSKDDAGTTTYDVFRGDGPGAQNALTNTNGMSQSGVPAGGTSVNRPGTPAASSEPIGELMPSFIDFLKVDDPGSVLYGQSTGDWSKYPDTEEARSVGRDASGRYISTADWLWDRHGKTELAFNDTQLENTTNFFQNRYRDTKMSINPMTGQFIPMQGDENLLKRHQARNLARQYIEISSDNPYSSDPMWQASTLSRIDNAVTQTTLSDQMVSIAHDTMPTAENGLGSASSLAFDGRSLGEWIKETAGEPMIRDPSRIGPDGRPAALGYSEEQVAWMKKTADDVRFYGDMLCDAAGCSPDDTSNVSSQIGSFFVQMMHENGVQVPTDEQKNYALRYLYKYGKIVKSLPTELQDTLRSLSTGRISLSDLSSMPDSQSQSTDGSVSQSAPTTNPSTADQLRNGFNSWMDSRNQPTDTAASRANQYGIPSTMQTGHGVNLNGQGVGTDKRSAMKGSRGRSVSFNPQVGVREVDKRLLGRKSDETAPP
ncbi:uncharacterized protein I303_103646 [Kwoniella dejecticola CBS 10117]|uniref:Uncharacterized protein n=1 Tax=Kwoniella dejecticola CBS 10117 TaxID=1296121 RepID=A0A1A6A7B7_9TREE|nr:uncharacterized protein I303_03667 [Kwoniella dejecticola CBS 10117]OBR85952.1 hypothetical protein I303_03667 [Kwoniella dejecticola CBS 10117]